MANLRRHARGKPCLIRIHPQCSGGGDDTVLCHFSMAGNSGMGMKPHDLAYAAYGCSKCHDVVDFRAQIVTLSRTEIRLAHAKGVMRTVEMLAKEGVIKW